MTWAHGPRFLQITSSNREVVPCSFYRNQKGPLDSYSLHRAYDDAHIKSSREMMQTAWESHLSDGQVLCLFIKATQALVDFGTHRATGGAEIHPQGC